MIKRKSPVKGMIAIGKRNTGNILRVWIQEFPVDRHWNQKQIVKKGNEVTKRGAKQWP